jgi:VIT1/CCC1 family predicted Fe2+/Mn2+ transporter
MPAEPIDIDSDASANEEGTDSRSWLRAAVLGADDGIVSTAALIVGVAASDASASAILTAGLAGLVAGAASMAAGEFVSVSAQRDLENALRRREQSLVARYPDVALTELSIALQIRGIEPATAREVARQLAAAQAVDAGVSVKYGLTAQAQARPLQAALASAAAFAAGAVVPSAGVLGAGVEAAVIAALIALGATGALAADAGGAPRGRAAMRVLAGGSLAMAISALIGRVVGVLF